MNYSIDVVERFITGANIRRDFLGFADLIGCHATEGIVAIQACAGASHADRLAKVKAAPGAAAWLAAGGRIHVVSWRLAGERGKRKLWTARVENVTNGKGDSDGVT
jgi:hypothetical protein